MSKFVRHAYRSIILTLFLVFSSISVFAQTTTPLSVSLLVPLSATDIPLSISRTSGEQVAAENELLEYQITYGSTLSSAIPVTITASWNEGTLNGSPITLADYVPGSATPGYGATPPVIDTVHHTITWTIASLPAGASNNSVSFTLKTRDSYQGSETIPFTITAAANSNGAQVPEATLTQEYHHTPVVITPTTTPVVEQSNEPTTSPTQNTSTTPSSTTTPVSSSPTITAISVETISPTTAQVQISVAKPGKITLRYGTTPTKLARSIVSEQPDTTYLVTIPDLTMNTTYYFTVTYTSGYTSVTSDLYTITTAGAVSIVDIDTSSLVITAQNTILAAPGTETTTSTVVITKATTFEFRFAIKNSEHITRLQAFLKPISIPGTAVGSTMTQPAEIVEIAKGIYTGKVKTMTIPGSYVLSVRIRDDRGNIREQPVTAVKVVTPLTIVERESRHPVEHARVLISRKNPTTNQFSVLSEQAITRKNPLFSEPDGTVILNLMQGDYKITVSTLGYQTKDVFFSIDQQNGHEYPVVLLEKQPFNIITRIQYYQTTSSDFSTSLLTYVAALGISSRLFELIGILVLFLFCTTTLLSFCIRNHIPVLALPAYVFSHIHLHKQHLSLKKVTGTVTDADTDGYPVAHAIVYLLDAKRDRILLHTQTDALGNFTLFLVPATTYALRIKKYRYTAALAPVNPGESVSITLYRDQAFTNHPFVIIGLFFRNLIGLCFEMLLLSSLILEIVFSITFGFTKSLPYLMLTIATLSLWLLFIKNHRSLYRSN